MKRANRILTVLIFVFLYVPMAVLIVASFNTGKDVTQFEGFTLRQYTRLFQDRTLLKLLGNSLLVSILASFIATVFGTVASLGIYTLNPRLRKAAMTLTNIPMTMPDIVTGISLMLLFLFTKVERGLITMIMAHITFNTPYVILSVMPKLKQMNKHSYEAALDLGATPGYALTHVIIPEIRQGIITGAMLAFTLSLDDFTISYFTTSPMVQNLSTLIYSKARIGIDPTLNALSALMFVALLVLLIIVNRRTADNSQKA